MPQYLIDTPDEIDDTCRRLVNEAVVGVDTEFLRVRTYYPKLALVQVSTGGAIYCFDPLVDGLELDKLWEVLADTRILKVMHAARQDIEVLRHTAGIMPEPLFDTQIAAALAGYGDQVGYAGLVEAEFGETLPKSSQRTDWTRRPLSEAQLGYAENDVRYLLPLYDRLSDRLRSLGRYEWAQEDFDRDLDPGLYQAEPDLAYRRIGRAAHLDVGAQHALKRLCSWRENEARARDLPRNWVLDDVAAAVVAAGRPRSVRELAQIEGVRSDTVRRHGAAIVACLDQLTEHEAPLWRRHDSLTTEQKALKEDLAAVLKVRAAELGISRSVLVTRADLDKLVRGVPAKEVISGWRWDVIGRDMQRVLDDGVRPSPNAGLS